MSKLWMRPNGNRLHPLPDSGHSRFRWAEIDHNGFWVNAHTTLPDDAIEATA